MYRDIVIIYKCRPKEMSSDTVVQIVTFRVISEDWIVVGIPYGILQGMRDDNLVLWVNLPTIMPFLS